MDEPVAWLGRERREIAEYLRYCANSYPQSSDGRNTFVMAAEWVEARSTQPVPADAVAYADQVWTECALIADDDKCNAILARAFEDYAARRPQPAEVERQP